MQCRQCGTEIADKALVCYKCGTATTEAKYQPAAARPRRSSLSLITSVLALALFVVLALYLQRMVTVGASRTFNWVFVAFAVVIVALRAFARRTGR